MDTAKIKIGDGITSVNELPFAEEQIMSLPSIDRVEDETIIMKKD